MTTFEDELRARGRLHWHDKETAWVTLTMEERDVLADAIEALREIAEDTRDDDTWASDLASQAIAGLDALARRDATGQ